MDKQEIARQVREYIGREMPKSDVELTDTTNLLEEWFVDSMQVVQIVMFIESQFGVDVYRADINGQNFRNIETISQLVAGRLAG